MAGNMSILPSRHRKIENSGHRVREIGRLASTLSPRYDFREPGGYLGNVGFGDSRSSPKRCLGTRDGPDLHYGSRSGCPQCAIVRMVRHPGNIGSIK